MSTPVKPPGGSGVGATDSPDDASGSERAEGPRGELRSEVERASRSNVEAASASTETSSIEALGADVKAGKLGADAAVERLVQRALAQASGLSPAHRAALEAQLRAALAEDPALIALRKDLERASSS